MTISVVFDTNVLVYASDAAEVAKRDTALQVISAALVAGTACLTLQTLGEFVRASMRRGVIPLNEIAERVEVWSEAFTVLAALPSDLHAALRLLERHSLQFWDAMMLSTCARNGMRWLVTEDMQDGATLLGITLLNPFETSNQAKLKDLGLA